MSEAGGYLFGRRTYELFAAHWPKASEEEQALAEPLNTRPKYVVSSTLEQPQWNATLLEGDVVNAVATLKQTINGDIAVYGSGQLAHTLIEHDLVDELRLMIYPCALGTGDRLFAETSHKKPMQLVDARLVGDSLAYLTYQPVRTA